MRRPLDRVGMRAVDRDELRPRGDGVEKSRDIREGMYDAERELFG
jgi:hypothetical protein